MNNILKKRLILNVIIFFSIAVTLTACLNEKKETISKDFPKDNLIVMGNGANRFYFCVESMDGNILYYDIHTDKENVGEALSELGILSGDYGSHGMYVKTINGETLDYNKDGKYWAFYVNGVYATASADKTKINVDDIYMFRPE